MRNLKVFLLLLTVLSASPAWARPPSGEDEVGKKMRAAYQAAKDAPVRDEKLLEKIGAKAAPAYDSQLEQTRRENREALQKVDADETARRAEKKRRRKALGQPTKAASAKPTAGGRKKKNGRQPVDEPTPEPEDAPSPIVDPESIPKEIEFKPRKKGWPIPDEKDEPLPKLSAEPSADPSADPSSTPEGVSELEFPRRNTASPRPRPSRR